MLEGILKETHGVIIYQEQVMQIAQVLAGYSLGDADLLRRAMGKKDKAEMAKQQQRFVDGAMKNSVKKSDAVTIFELVDKFAGYGFNKSHAAAYAVVSYHTAYLKANFREEFLAASMTLDMSNTDKLAMFAAEARRSGIEVKPPCVNTSDVDFLAEPPKAPAKHGAIRYSMAAIKNIGAGAVLTIVKERREAGRFRDLSDFASRLQPKALNKRGLETLSAAGAFDGLDPNRALVSGNAEQMLALSNRLASNKADGIVDLFAGGAAASGPSLDMRATKAWTPTEKLAEEFKAIGFYLTGHPLDAYQTLLPKLGVVPFLEFEQRVGLAPTSGRLAAIVVAARERRSARGKKYAFGMFSDATAQFEAVIFSDTLDAAGDLLTPGTAVIVSVEAEREGETIKMRVGGLEALEKAAASVQRGMTLVLDRRMIQQNRAKLDQLRALLVPGAPGKGGGEVRFRIGLEDRERELEFALPGRFDVSPTQQGLISTIPGVLDVIDL
jgi:DNA polymerase III subunit alpha